MRRPPSTHWTAGVRLLATGLYRQSRYTMGWLWRYSQVADGVVISRNLRLPMPDGVTLATDHYRPKAQGAFPTILIRTPYGRGGLLGMRLATMARQFAARGYHVICQDVRGCFDSGGRFDPFVQELADGQATLEWIARQRWFNGAVGLWGSSYVGYTQWATAVSGSSFVKAIVPAVTRSDVNLLAEETFPLDLTLRWSMIMDTLLDDGQLSRWQRLNRLANRREQERRLASGFAHLPLGTADAAATGRPIPFYRAWHEHIHTRSAYWQSVDLSRRIASVAAPAHFVSGWYDVFLDGLLRDFALLRAAGRSPYLTIGPWRHVDPDCQQEAFHQGLPWFGAHLKGQPGHLRPYPVRLFVMGAGEWRDLDAWPPPAQTTPYYLHAGGRLALATPARDDPADHYLYDPANPTPNLGGPLLALDAGPVDNRFLEARPDVLTYTTPPLTADVEIIGPVQLVIFVYSSLEHTDFFGRLCDLYPDGRSINLCDGLIRVQPGRGERQPDGSLRLVIDMVATAHRFLKGHAIRLQVSSGAHPRFARNLGTGEPYSHSTRAVAAEQTIYHDAAHPSAVILPVTGDCHFSK
ncbi:MAG: CocE/NonD family hydrolase [Chloroflexi bacterium]|nr:CocE/NonD family hydrolase [Chloroflexota bacterium]